MTRDNFMEILINYYLSVFKSIQIIAIRIAVG